uniref:Uncharacterized protein n=1 Tax=Arundo donax TaxID=35708 RepID=A0A0A9FQ27_ARUDO
MQCFSTCFVLSICNVHKKITMFCFTLFIFICYQFSFDCHIRRKHEDDISLFPISVVELIQF